MATVIPALPALANHGDPSTVNVGIRESDNVVRDEVDDASLAIGDGTTLTFDWDVAAQFHDVTWESGNPEVFATVGPTSSGTAQYAFTTMTRGP